MPELETMEVAEALGLLRCLAPPAGGDHGTLLRDYGLALGEYPKWAIVAVVRKFLRGEVDGQSLVSCPTTADLVAAVRDVMTWRDPDPELLVDTVRAWLTLPADGRAVLPFSEYATDLVVAEWNAFPDVRAAFATIDDFLKYRCQIAMATLADVGRPH